MFSLLFLFEKHYPCAGKNDYGQIGQDFSEDMKLTPTPVVSSLGHSELVIAIAAGYYHTLALTSNGELYTYVFQLKHTLHSSL